MNQQQKIYSPNFWARMGGIAYLIIIIAGASGELLIRNKIVISNDPQTTANNLLSHALLWRIGIAGDLLMHVCDLFLSIAYFQLFRLVNRPMARLSLFFGLMQTAVLIANKMNLVMPLLYLEHADKLQAFSLPQLQEMAFLSIQAHDYGFGNGLIFFGFACIIDAYLIIQSGFLPKFLGWFIGLAGICYLINSFTLLLAPSFSPQVFPVVMPIIFLSELSLCLWLLIKGVKMEKSS
ncbi:MAG: hypothetical protein CFE25_03050 [Chitinophagaceae bacterium BSSC1]|nr:MAG: hypothetical protein CFE25_03050 [Chitinophagaceae bacterium BSSC1]